MSLASKLAEERRARLAAERLLEQKQAELQAANRKLGRHAKLLSEQIHEKRAEVQTVLSAHEKVKTDLQVANQRIELAERRLWQSLEIIQDGFAFWDAEGRLIGANRAWLTVFDDLEEMAPGLSYVRMLQLATEEGIVDIGDKTPAQWREDMLDRWQAPSPEPRVIQLWNGQYIRMLDQRGHDGDIVTLALNITGSVRYQRRLSEARHRAEAANRAKSAFLASMSHEIRTPMNGVVGMADLLGDTELSEEQRLYVDTIRSSGEALLVIINDVLDYSKIEAEKLQLHPRPFDLERCIHEVMLLLQPTAREKGLSLLVDYDVFTPTGFVGDPGRIRQVLTNLVGNAVKFTSHGHVLIRVVGLPCPDSDRMNVTVTVEDTGIGIAPDKVAMVFGEFNQVDSESSRQFEGTGLGLAISQRLIGLMDGQIWVDSELGAGSSFGFRVTLPVPEGAAQSAGPEVLPHLGRVLVVDDDALHVSILEKQLDLLGAHPVTCSSGAEALEMLDDTIELVLTDHNMAEMDGLELAEEIRARGSQVPIILFSPAVHFAEMDPAKRFLHAILQRPTLRDDLFSVLRTLDQARAPLEAPPPPAEGAPPRLCRVLAAEDNRTNRLVFGKMLAGAEIDLRFAENGEEAVAAHAEFAPDVIFMDISMPGMDGKEATRRIRATEAGSSRHVPIVAMTAHALEGDEETILSAGLDHYLSKPLRKADVLDMLAQLTPADLHPPFQAAKEAEDDVSAAPLPEISAEDGTEAAATGAEEMELGELPEAPESHAEAIAAEETEPDEPAPAHAEEDAPAELPAGDIAAEEETPEDTPPAAESADVPGEGIAPEDTPVAGESVAPADLELTVETEEAVSVLDSETEEDRPEAGETGAEDAAEADQAAEPLPDATVDTGADTEPDTDHHGAADTAVDTEAEEAARKEARRKRAARRKAAAKRKAAKQAEEAMPAEGDAGWTAEEGGSETAEETPPPKRGRAPKR